MTTLVSAPLAQWLRTVRCSTFRCLTLYCLASTLSATAFAQESNIRITPLTALDRQDLQNKAATIDEIARSRLGTEVHQDRSDIDTLQRIANGKFIDPKDTKRLQATGVVLGNVLKKEFDLEWVVYEDADGRSRALCVPKTEQCLFPVTMISRRLEVDAPVDVQAIYDRAAAIIKPYADKAKVYQPSTLVRPQYIPKEEPPKPKKEPIKVRFE